MTDNEWMETAWAVKQRYLDEGKTEERARKLAAEYMRQMRLDIARASLKIRDQQP